MIIPLMYHVRTLPHNPVASTQKQKNRLEEKVKYWGNSFEVRQRLEENQNATAHVVLFLEYVPETVQAFFVRKKLRGWRRLKKQF